MKQRILIIGSGFAGMWAAVSAARVADLQGASGLEIAVISPKPEMGVRPRFYEANVRTLTADLRPLFAALTIRHIAGSVESIDAAGHTVDMMSETGERLTLAYDRLIVAAGSHLRPAGAAGVAEYTFNIDSMDAAARLETHLQQLTQQPASDARNTVVVCGGGFTGIELATELPGRLQSLFGDDTKTKVIVV